MITSDTQRLREEGVHVMLKQIRKELQTGDDGVHLRALRALAGMAKRSSSTSMSVRTVQDGFRVIGGFAPLMKVLNGSLASVKSLTSARLERMRTLNGSSEEAVVEKRVTVNAALECFHELLKCSPENCLAATQAGLVSALTTCIFPERQHPPNPVTLKLLYVLVSCEEHAALIHDTMVSCLTIPALVRLLDACLVFAPQQHRSAWCAEVLGVLSPLVHKCRDAADQIVTLGGLHSLAELIKQPATEPLALSQMLDILEVLVSTGEASVQAEVRHMIVRNGLLQPILQTLRRPGLNLKTAQVLTHLVQEPGIVKVLQAVISPRTLHELCKIALSTNNTDDLQASACSHVISQILSMGSLLSLRNLVLGRCMNIALHLPQACHEIVSLAMSEPGQAVIDNLSHEFKLDAALAAVHLFCICPEPSLLTKHDRLSTLLTAMLHESQLRLPPADALATLALLALLQRLNDVDPLTPASVPHFDEGSPVSTSASRSLASYTPYIPSAKRHDSFDPLLDEMPSISSLGGDSVASTSSLANAIATMSFRAPVEQWKSVEEVRQVSQSDSLSDNDLSGAGGLLPRGRSNSKTLRDASRRLAAVKEDTLTLSPTLHGAVAPPITKDDVNRKRYDTVTFLIGDREFYALGWMLEQTCPGLRDVLSQCDDVSCPLQVPHVPYMDDEELYTCFSLLVEFAYTGAAEVRESQCPGTWALAASLEFTSLQNECESRLMSNHDLLCAKHSVLKKTLLWSSYYHPDGALHLLCCRCVLSGLEEARDQGILAAAADAEECRHNIVAGLLVCLTRRIQRAMECGTLDTLSERQIVCPPSVVT